MLLVIRLLTVIYFSGRIYPVYSDAGFEPYYANSENDIVIYQDDLFEKKKSKSKKKRKKAIQKMLNELHRYKEFNQLELSQVKKRRKSRRYKKRSR